jgi:hypothetical protein
VAEGIERESMKLKAFVEVSQILELNELNKPNSAEDITGTILAATTNTTILTS